MTRFLASVYEVKKLVGLTAWLIYVLCSIFVESMKLVGVGV